MFLQLAVFRYEGFAEFLDFGSVCFCKTCETFKLLDRRALLGLDLEVDWDYFGLCEAFAVHGALLAGREGLGNAGVVEHVAAWRYG